LEEWVIVSIFAPLKTRVDQLSAEELLDKRNNFKETTLQKGYGMLILFR